MSLPQLQNRLRVQTEWLWSYFTGQQLAIDSKERRPGVLFGGTEKRCSRERPQERSFAAMALFSRQPFLQKIYNFVELVDFNRC